MPFFAEVIQARCASFQLKCHLEVGRMIERSDYIVSIPVRMRRNRPMHVLIYMIGERRRPGTLVASVYI